jgi:uncharacterized membrane protein HdeD (DUF308 family)
MEAAMVMASETPILGELRDRWGWFVALGVLMIVAGFIALMSVLMATIVRRQSSAFCWSA